MKVFLKLVLFSVLFTTFSCSVFLPEPDKRMMKLMSDQDWFELEREYKTLSREVKNPTLTLFAGTLLDIYFNRPDRAIEKIDTLRTNYRKDLDAENYSNLILLYSRMLWQKGEYGKAAGELENFLTGISPSDLKDYDTHTSLYGLLSVFKDVPIPEMIRPQHDVVLPMIIENIGRGSVMTVEVTINDKPYKFYFDSGAGMSAISSRLANELGAKILMDSIDISGANQTTGSLATIDRLSVGDIEYRNPILVVLPPTPIDSIVSFDAILGIDFIRTIGETHIYPQEKKIVFPYEFSGLPEYGRNLMMREDGQSYIDVASNEEKLLFHFDTGNVEYDLQYTYYQKHKNMVTEVGEKVTVMVGGFGDIQEKPAYRLSSFPITVGDTDVALSDVNVFTEQVLDAQGNEDGALGYGFIKLCKKVIISFDKMFMKVLYE